jgi:hypothetical protein
LGPLVSMVKFIHTLVSTKNGFGHILGDFFHKLIRSPFSIYCSIVLAATKCPTAAPVHSFVCPSFCVPSNYKQLEIIMSNNPVIFFLLL